MRDAWDEEEGVYVGLGWGERWAIPMMIIGLVSIPLLSIPVLETTYDFLRVLVLVQAIIVLGVQLTTIFGNIRRSINAQRAPQQPLVIRTLRWAYTARVAASTIMVAILSYGVTVRLGNSDVTDWRTPTLQLCLLLLALAWGFMDRRILWLERRADTPEFLRMIEQMQALQSDRKEDERRRAESKS